MSVCLSQNSHTKAPIPNVIVLGGVVRKGGGVRQGGGVRLVGGVRRGGRVLGHYRPVPG